MAVTVDHLIAKADGIIIASKGITEKERTHGPSESFLRDYNALREQMLKLLPDLIDIMPPPVEIFKEAMTSRLVANENYSEILGYVNQIRGMLVRSK